MSDATDPLPDRRRFLATLGDWSLRILVGSVAAGPAVAAAFDAPPYRRAPLPGACLAPVTGTEQTLAALLDAVVPGGGSDPEGEAGALEACAMNLLADDAYPFRELGDLVAGLMDGLALGAHGQPFAALSVEQRLLVIIDAQESLPILRLAYRAIRSAFYGGAYNGVGLDYVGFPGPSLGYRHIPEFSFRKPVCEEMTDTGYLP